MRGDTQLSMAHHARAACAGLPARSLRWCARQAAPVLRHALPSLHPSVGRISGCGFAEATPPDGSAFDVIINGTSASLAGELPPLTSSVIGPETVCYDMMYGKGLTVFNRWAREHGAARVIDGLGMLVEQAAEAFELWRGVRPDTAPVMAELRGERRR